MYKNIKEDSPYLYDGTEFKCEEIIMEDKKEKIQIYSKTPRFIPLNNKLAVPIDKYDPSKRFKVDYGVFGSFTENDIRFMYDLQGKKAGEKLLIFRGPRRPLFKTFKDLARNAFFHDTYISLFSLKDERKKIRYRTSKKEFVKVNTVTNKIIDEYTKEEKKYFGRLNTSGENVKYVQAIMIDIDCHTDNKKLKLTENEFSLLAHYLNENLKSYKKDGKKFNFAPHYINFTGRGLQIFYLVNEYDPHNSTLFNLAKDLRSQITRLIKPLIKKACNSIGVLKSSEKAITIDNSTSVMRQIARLPGTVNRKSDSRMPARVLYRNPMCRYSMSDLIQRINSAIGRLYSTSNKKDSYTPNITNPVFLKTNLGRIKHLKKWLLNMGVGTRNNTYCCITSLMLSSGIDEEIIKEELIKIDEELQDNKNAGYFKDDKAVKRHIDDMKKYWTRQLNEGEVLQSIKLSNKTLREFCNIELTDVEALGLDNLGVARSELLKDRRKVKEEMKQAMMGEIKRCLSTGENVRKELNKDNLTVNITYLSKFFNISRNTVYSIIKEMNARETIKKFDTINRVKELNNETLNSLDEIREEILQKLNFEKETCGGPKRQTSSAILNWYNNFKDILSELDDTGYTEMLNVA